MCCPASVETWSRQGLGMFLCGLRLEHARDSPCSVVCLHLTCSWEGLCISFCPKAQHTGYHLGSSDKSLGGAEGSRALVLTSTLTPSSGLRGHCIHSMYKTYMQSYTSHTYIHTKRACITGFIHGDVCGVWYDAGGYCWMLITQSLRMSLYIH